MNKKTIPVLIVVVLVVAGFWLYGQVQDANDRQMAVSYIDLIMPHLDNATEVTQTLYTSIRSNRPTDQAFVDFLNTLNRGRRAIANTTPPTLMKRTHADLLAGFDVCIEGATEAREALHLAGWSMSDRELGRAFMADCDRAMNRVYLPTP